VPLAETSDEMNPADVGAADDDSGASPEQQLSNKDMHQCIRHEIGKLHETQRIVLMLNALDGQTDDEIAGTLGISRENVKVRLHRARQAFKKIIEALCDFYRNELSCKPASPECCHPARQPSNSH
jgi:RNA polymerase sigma-70 factor (ECF subfamily)